MTKKIKQKIEDFSLPIPSTDVSANTKKQLYTLFGKYGMSQSTAYLRLFSKGFEAWELIGIDSFKKDFLERHKSELLMADSVDEDGNINEGDRGYAAVLALNSDEPGGFYRALKEVGLVRSLKEEMFALGMSPATTYNRFTTDEWKQWELVGARTVLREFADAVGEDDDI